VLRRSLRDLRDELDNDAKILMSAHVDKVIAEINAHIGDREDEREAERRINLLMDVMTAVQGVSDSWAEWFARVTLKRVEGAKAFNPRKVWDGAAEAIEFLLSTKVGPDKPIYLSYLDIKEAEDVFYLCTGEVYEGTSVALPGELNLRLKNVKNNDKKW